MWLFKKHLEQMFPPPDQTEMSFLPASMPTPGGRKGNYTFWYFGEHGAMLEGTHVGRKVRGL